MSKKQKDVLKEVEAKIVNSVIDEMASELQSLRDEMKILQEKEDNIKTEIKAFMDDIEASCVSGEKFTITAKISTRSGLDRAKISEILNEKQVAACTKVTQFVQIKVSRKT
jgi:hypothetical protein